MPLLCPPRRREPEWMDQSDLDEGLHLAALDGLGRINALSRTAGALWPPINNLFQTNSARRWKVLDVACGGGDVAVAIARRARSAGYHATVDGCDVSPVALARSNAHASATGVTQMTFFRRDAVRDGLPDGYDVVMCSLFLHHLDEVDAIRLLRSMANAAQRLVLVSDLRRGLPGNVLAWAACHLLSRSPVVRDDGPKSARAAFTLAEAGELARRSGLDDARLERCWPQRFLLQWSRPCPQ